MPQASPAQDGGLPRAEEHEQRQQRRQGAGAGAQHELRVILLAQDQSAPRKNDEPGHKQRQNGRPKRIVGKRVKPKAAQYRQQGDGQKIGAEAGIDDERGQQVYLRAQYVAHTSQRAFQKDRHKRRQQNQDGIQPAHGIFTNTSFSEFRLTASFTRTSE